MLTCPKCNYPNEHENDVCSLCSTMLPLRPIPKKANTLFAEPRMLKAGKVTAPRHKKVSDDRVHTLVPPSGAPIALEPNIRFVMGRDARSTLPVHAEDVSRQHAEILWSGEPAEPAIADIRSRNGTFVNGERLAAGMRRELRHGDVIRLAGSFVLSYRFKAPPDLEKELLAEKRAEDTQAVRLPAELAGEARPASGITRTAPPPAEAARDGETALQGAFGTLTARQVLLLLEHLRASGRLVVRCGSATGSVVLRDGVPVEVEYAGVTGVPAVVAIGNLVAGRFAFHATGEARP